MNIDIVWQEYRSLLKGYLANKVSNPVDAEDLLQNILIKVHLNLPKLTELEKLKPWLLQIAKHTIIDFYRTQGQKRQLTAKDLWYENEQDTDHELIECITPFIKCLPEKYQTPLQAIDVDGQEQKYFAELHGINYSTLKSRVQKGRQELKRLFYKCCDLELDAQGNAISCLGVKSDCGGC